jgi:hypothetical protein
MRLYPAQTQMHSAHPSTLSENVAAGQRYAVLMYGLQSDGQKILAAPIAAP